jgi:nucleoside-diphosphate-sugar epimerase
MAKVCVTGASGFIGGHLVKQLLEKGYTVHACVRDINDDSKIAVLKSLQQQYTAKKLVLFQADLEDKNAYDNAISGCTFVFHLASPFFVPTPEQDLVKVMISPAKNGTLNGLSSVLKHKSTVKRVIITSSEAAVYDLAKVENGKTYTEDDWNTVSKIEEPGGAYKISKYIAEKTAWEFCSQNGIEMVSICPALIFGPLLQKKINSSMDLIRTYLAGEVSDIPQFFIPYVDVRDVARAHILAAETKKAANQRYICNSGMLEWTKVVEMLRRMFPKHPIPHSIIPMQVTR